MESKEIDAKRNKALSDAYDVCWQMKDHCDNVIASGEGGESDKRLSKKATNFIKWYNKEGK